eukprot:SAG22_NODE_43_length_25304_cov_5.394644_11_plen_381_part_00
MTPPACPRPDDLGYGDLGFNGHPTTSTPNIDKLAWGGKVLSSWYSGCPVCSGSRAALMTGRQWNRIGVPGVFGPSVTAGLPLNETTVADQLKKADYATAIMGKWWARLHGSSRRRRTALPPTHTHAHPTDPLSPSEVSRLKQLIHMVPPRHLGQRPMYLPAARGFDEYLGIPYSDDMGSARRSPCPGKPEQPMLTPDDYVYTEEDNVHGGDIQNLHDLNRGGSAMLPLVYQSGGVPSTVAGETQKYAANTTVLEQPLDFSTLAVKYSEFVIDFIERSAAKPFFLYMPFSHVHTTSGNQPQKQYAGCSFQNTSLRGEFGDALAEVDWIVGNVVDKLEAAKLSENTVRQRSSPLKAVITAFPCVSLPFLAVPLLSHRTVAIS